MVDLPSVKSAFPILIPIDELSESIPPPVCWIVPVHRSGLNPRVEFAGVLLGKTEYIHFANLVVGVGRLGRHITRDDVTPLLSLLRFSIFLFCSLIDLASRKKPPLDVFVD